MNSDKKKLLYLSHPSSGLEENTRDVEKVIRKLYSNEEIYNKYCIVSPIHCYGFMYFDNPEHEYDFRGLSYCTDLLKHCSVMVVVGNWRESIGCTEEVKLAEELNIETLFLETSSLLDVNNDLIEKLTNIR